ncbi:AraC family transcriptional regulator [uncultured Tateyamaria sp.]|uniref:helix-turn-helix transcriptional regulator n=1 Tax=uncultured Tateyamaria sp. TaxID=455651 RepID=UPI00261828CD|nr:AraC family transcriptional regulator [uncultured Tateyamaria sp.]
MRRTHFHIESYLREDEAFHFARKKLATRYPGAAHDHDYFEVFLIENGRTAHWVNGVTQTLEPGHLAFIRPGDVHAFSADRKSGCQIINVMFRIETAEHLAKRYQDTIAGRFFDARGALPELHTLGPARFSRAVNVADQLQTARRSLAGIEEFLLVLVNRVVHASSNLNASTPRWFAEACSAALAPDVFRLGAAGLISAAGRSHEHVCRTCKVVTGMTPSEYINRIRIEHAGQLLRSTEEPIEDVIEACGFQNTSYFYRLFRSQTGSTPRAYRLAGQRDPFQPVGQS